METPSSNQEKNDNQAMCQFNEIKAPHPSGSIKDHDMDEISQKERDETNEMFKDERNEERRDMLKSGKRKLSESFDDHTTSVEKYELGTNKWDIANFVDKAQLPREKAYELMQKVYEPDKDFKFPFRVWKEGKREKKR